MLSSLNSGVAGIRNFQSKLDVIGNNIANSNTLAYKAARTNFADTFSQTLQGGTTAGGAIQVGTGMQISSIKNDYGLGGYQETGIESNLYIDGKEGFFIVKDFDGVEHATRAGDFVRDKDGYLVTNEGYRLQGFSDHTTKDGAMSTRGDIQITDANRPATVTTLRADAEYAGYAIRPDGRVRLRLDDGTEYDVGQVLLQKFEDPNLLEKQGNNLYGNLREAGPIGGDALTSTVPGTQGTGQLRSKSLEMSNVDLAGEFADMITTQRGFQANARIITTSDEMLQEVVNLKR
jgi:flagellar hook protein FlgE